MSLLFAALLPLAQVSPLSAYKFDPGLELVYQVETELHYGGKPVVRKEKISLAVLGKDEEKGALVAVRSGAAGGRGSRFGLFWVSPEGKFRLHELVRRAWWGVCPLEVLPPLPVRGKGPWVGGRDVFGTSLAVTGAEEEKDGRLLLSFRFRFTEPEEKVYGREGGGKAWFDPAEGYVTGVTFERGSGRFPRSTRVKVTLAERFRHAGEWTASLRSALEDYLRAQAVFYGLGSWLPENEKEVAEKVKEMKALFEKVAEAHRGTPVEKAARVSFPRSSPW